MQIVGRFEELRSSSSSVLSVLTNGGEETALYSRQGRDEMEVIAHSCR
jgi:hypothetical protein